jgi:hypothetical protein
VIRIEQAANHDLADAQASRQIAERLGPFTTLYR